MNCWRICSYCQGGFSDDITRNAGIFDRRKSKYHPDKDDKQKCGRFGAVKLLIGCRNVRIPQSRKVAWQKVWLLISLLQFIASSVMVTRLSEIRRSQIESLPIFKFKRPENTSSTKSVPSPNLQNSHQCPCSLRLLMTETQLSIKSILLSTVVCSHCSPCI
jgi:hypothetical protein